jgi:hypothetical protein
MPRQIGMRLAWCLIENRDRTPVQRFSSGRIADGAIEVCEGAKAGRNGGVRRAMQLFRQVQCLAGEWEGIGASAFSV